MANRVKLKVAERSNLGRTAVKRTRTAGLVPAVLYGRGQAQTLEVNRVELAQMLNSSTSENILVDLEVGEGKKRMAILQDIQKDPLKDTVLHVDFHEIDESMKLHVEVPVLEVGEPVGVKTGGGILDHVLRTLRVECLPKDLPSSIQVDVSALNIGQAIHVGEIALPTGVTVMNAKDLAVFIVHAPKTEEELAAETTATAETQSPEVIKEKKEGEEAVAGSAPSAGALAGATTAKAPEKGAEAKKAEDKGKEKKK
ncbi:MAG: 50S ribosomal protein L25 [Verrucomicrobiota bacterium]